MLSRTKDNLLHYFVIVLDDGSAMSACGHVTAHASELELEALDPLYTTCNGCLRSRHYHKSLKQLEESV